MPLEDAQQQFQSHGFKKEAALLRKQVIDLETANASLQDERDDLRATIIDRNPINLWPRALEYRRELLITLHNVNEWLRCSGQIVPRFDYKELGFKDHRTLHRSCRRFEQQGYLVKIRSNPSTFVLGTEAR